MPTASAAFSPKIPGAAEARDASGVSLLMQAFYRGRRDLADMIAARKKDLDIFEAASLGRLERLEECARNASLVNSHSKDGFTALHFACFFGQPEAVRLLIGKGAEIDSVACNPMKVMPLHSAHRRATWRRHACCSNTALRLTPASKRAGFRSTLRRKTAIVRWPGCC